jgi:hypothetical protein
MVVPPMAAVKVHTERVNATCCGQRQRQRQAEDD